MAKLVLFDCDGVLINTEEVGYKVLCDMLAAQNISYTRIDYVKMLSGITYSEFHEKLRAAHPELPANFRDELDARMKEAMKTQMTVIDGIKELLDRLKMENIPFTICSNSGAESLIGKLRHSQVDLLDKFVYQIYSRHHVENAKPAPDMYKLAAQTLGVAPEDCIVVEDSITGTMAGVAAGMKVIGFVGESHRDAEEVDLLVNAGAKMIALNAQQIWEHISDFAGLTPRFPFMGAEVQL